MDNKNFWIRRFSTFNTFTINRFERIIQSRSFYRFSFFKTFLQGFFLFFVFGFGSKFENDIIIIITEVNVAQNFSRRIKIPWGYVVKWHFFRFLKGPEHKKKLFINISIEKHFFNEIILLKKFIEKFHFYTDNKVRVIVVTVKPGIDVIPLFVRQLKWMINHLAKAWQVRVVTQTIISRATFVNDKYKFANSCRK